MTAARRGGLASRQLGPLALLLAAIGPATVLANAPPPTESSPEVTIVSPPGNETLAPGKTTVTVIAQASDAGDSIREVRLFVDGRAVRTSKDETAVFLDVPLSPGEHEIVAGAESYSGEKAESAPRTIVVAGTPQRPDDDAAGPANATPDPAVPDAASQDGCFASVRPRSLIEACVAFAFAVIAGLALRRTGT